MLQRFNFTGAGQARAIGRHLHIASSNAATLGVSDQIDVFVNGQSIGRLVPGDSITLDAEADQWDLIPVAPTLGYSVLIGRGQVRSSRISGAVEIIDGSASKTIAGEQFWSGLSRAAAAAQFPSVALGNPASSGQRVVVRSLAIVNGTTAGVWRLFSATGYSTVFLAQRQPKNKIIDAAPSGAQCRLQTHDSTSATAPSFAPVDLTAWTELGQGRLAANASEEIVNGNPFVIDPGFTLALIGGVAAAELAIRVQFEEIPYAT